ncbi:MAG: porin family protein [Saprospiraceae bacterium]|nr:PorT family protein [Lewinella sp.]
MKFYLMKSTIVLLFTAGVMSMSGYAQTFLGLKGGLTASRITYQFDAGEPYLEYQPRLAPHVGLMAEFRLSDRLYFQPELLYVEKGSRGKALSSIESPHFTERFQSLVLPLLLSARLGERLSLTAGPEFEYLIRTRLLVDGKNPGTPSPSSLFDEKKFLLNVDAEVGYRLHRLQLSLRAGLPLLPVAKIDYTDVNGEVSETAKYYNQVLQLSLAYRLIGD